MNGAEGFDSTTHKQFDGSQSSQLFAVHCGEPFDSGPRLLSRGLNAPISGTIHLCAPDRLFFVARLLPLDMMLAVNMSVLRQ